MRFLEIGLQLWVSCFLGSNISNLNKTPIPFKYLEGKTYNVKAEKTIWAKLSQNVWDKYQALLVLCIFADGIPRVPPMIIFHGKGERLRQEWQHYDPHMVVKFNPKAYVNSSTIVKWLDKQLVPVLESCPTLLVLNLFSPHKTEEVLNNFSANDIIISLILGDCTALVQPLDVSINQPFKDILKEVLEERLDVMEREEEEILLAGGRLTGSMIGRRRVLTIWAVGEAWEYFSHDHKEVIVKAFQVLGISLPISSAIDQEISVKGIDSTFLINGLQS
ncbi:hypothetical protein L873DRAFT_1768961 [Choiromyces venosus 120613-1]|uniref:DDE-1 domain-containing protein n=1 Tax=Choiromyces venosus 120613-1 TaxID=1336337 RepID=A0A3N4JKE7_9PEZI|nr:hypothetical protein L873DRAFT_1768961 [Choiromyces venosus 120613-1]